MIRFQGQTILSTLEEIANPSHTLLLVYDAFNLTHGRTDNKYSFGTFNQTLPDMVPRWLRLIEGARRAQVPLVYTRQAHIYAYSSGPWIRYWMKYFGVSDPAQLPNLEPTGSAENQIIQELRPRKGEVVLDKYFNSAFSGTPLRQFLQSRNIKTLVLTGIATESGIETNCRQAVIEGYYVVVPEDCVNSGHPEMHEAALKYMTRCAELTTVDELLGIWSTK